MLDRLAPAEVGPRAAPRVLMIAFEDGRSGPCRLAQPLAAAGIAVATLSPPANLLTQSGFVAERFPLPASRSSRRLTAALERAVADWRPDLVIPCDEQVVAFLHDLVRRAHSGHSDVSPALSAVLAASLGDPARHPALLMKSETLALARAIGVAAPRGAVAASAAEGVCIAGDIGYPVFAKTSFGWAGSGVARCDDPGALAKALAPPRRGRLGPLKTLARRLLRRDWYPERTSIEVQQAISGSPAMVAAVALDGRMLACFSAMARRTVSATGPSTLVEIMHHAAMEEAARRMIGALGASGFIGFDFMIEAASGAALLLECNPRPIQIGHLGGRIGSDLCAALAAGLQGLPIASPCPAEPELVALFPAAWTTGIAASLPARCHRDLPKSDPTLLRAIAWPLGLHSVAL